MNTGSEKLTGSLRGLSEQLSNGDTSGVVGQVLSEAGTRVQTLATSSSAWGRRASFARCRTTPDAVPGRSCSAWQRPGS